MDGSGRAIVVWSQNTTIWANRFVPGRGFGAPEIVAAPREAHAGEVALAVNSAGDALAVWGQVDGEGGSPEGLWASGSGSSGAWSPPERVASALTPASSSGTPVVALGTGGHAIVVWGSDGIVAVRHPPGQPWGPPTFLSDRGFAPLVAIDVLGRSLVAWSEGATAVAVALDSLGAFSIPVRFGAGPEGNFREGGLAKDATGRGLLAWERRTAPFDPAVVWAVSYDGEVWGPGTVISDRALKSYGPAVALQGRGAMAAWTVLGFPDRSDGAAANERAVGGTWASPTSIATGEGATTLDLALNDAGAGVAAWAQLESQAAAPEEKRYRLRASRHAGRVWSAAEPLQAGPGEAQYPQVAVDAQGNAIVVWLEDEGALRRVWANRFEAVRP